jgi:ankyrin repeat protein
MSDPREDFIKAAVWHGSLERAEAILAAHPEVATSDIHTAAIVGDDDAVRSFVGQDPANVTAKSPPYGGDALTYLCLSIYLRFDRTRTAAFLRAATTLLDAGADPNTGFWTTGQHPEFETALYGAAGVAHHPEMTRLLLERGADPNDAETPYHTPETYDNAVLAILVESGRLTADSLTTMLLRKADWHDVDGIRFLLEHGADPNRMTGWGFTALHQAVRRDNALKNIEEMLDHGADPTLTTREHSQSAVQIAARRGRGELLELFERRGFRVELQGVDRLIAACATDDEERVRSIAAQEPRLADEVVAQGGRLLAEFAGTRNTNGVRLLLELGVPIDAPYQGDGYFDIAPNSTALHVAAWKAHPSTVKLLIARGAHVDAVDGKGRTPLALAVKACVDSHWTDRRSPESVKALLDAGAPVAGVPYPSGYADVDELLKSHGA